MLLIFDLDGTIMDTWDEIVYVFERVFGRRGIPLDMGDLRMAVGFPLNEVIARLVGYQDEGLVEEIRREFLSMKSRRIRLFEGMDEVLRLPAKKAVFTSKGRVGTLRDLKYLGIEGYFDMVITADDVRKTKPDPEGIFAILSAIGEDHEDAFMIGDTEMDILAARNAGIKSIAVTWGNRDEDFLRKYNPDYLVKSPAELLKLLQAHL